MQNNRVGSSGVLTILLTVLALSSSGLFAGSEVNAAENPPVGKGPGLNAQDPFPRACVDCHVYLPAEKRDLRLTTLLKHMSVKTEPSLLSRLSNITPGGKPLQGRHPEVNSSKLSIPADCISCHKENSSSAPPFAGMMHLIHLSGENNHYLALFQGECGFCHKFDTKIGAWTVPSSPE